VATGHFEAALDRYDRADVLRPAHPMLDYRIGRLLDLQLSRPAEAETRYTRFLYQLEPAGPDTGEEAGLVNAAAAHARERLEAIGGNPN
jgi:hypothetical protein